MLRLEAASPNPPPGLQELLSDLGDGESGFSGTPVHTGAARLEEYLRQCCDMCESANLRPGLVPQAVFWVLDTDGIAVGMVRMRHFLNERLRVHGGHIGFFIRRDRRGRRHASEALRLALVELRGIGERRALLTADLDNIPSIKAIEANGGYIGGTGVDAETGKEFARYWIDLEAQQITGPNGIG
jgi:predicted acetyltransferase